MSETQTTLVQVNLTYNVRYRVGRWFKRTEVLTVEWQFEHQFETGPFQEALQERLPLRFAGKGFYLKVSWSDASRSGAAWVFDVTETKNHLFPSEREAQRYLRTSHHCLNQWLKDSSEEQAA